MLYSLKYILNRFVQGSDYQGQEGRRFTIGNRFARNGEFRPRAKGEILLGYNTESVPMNRGVSVGGGRGGSANTGRGRGLPSLATQGGNGDNIIRCK